MVCESERTTAAGKAAKEAPNVANKDKQIKKKVCTKTTKERAGTKTSKTAEKGSPGSAKQEPGQFLHSKGISGSKEDKEG